MTDYLKLQDKLVEISDGNFNDVRRTHKFLNKTLFCQTWRHFPTNGLQLRWAGIDLFLSIERKIRNERAQSG